MITGLPPSAYESFLLDGSPWTPVVQTRTRRTLFQASLRGARRRSDGRTGQHQQGV